MADPVIVYFGSRGAGIDFTKEIYLSLTENGQKVQALLLNPKLKAEFPAHSFRIIPIDFKSSGALKFLEATKSAKKIARTFIEQDASKTRVIFPMSSPYDIPLTIYLYLRGVRIMRVIHETKAHYGEWWPDPVSNYIYRKTTSNFIVLSEYVKIQLEKKTSKKILVLEHPIFRFVRNYQTSGKSTSSPIDQLLFIGRIKRYKGIDNLLESFKGLPQFTAELTIAGSGRIKNISNYKGIKLINRWLTNDEILAEIEKSTILVFPYIEASQSGLIPIGLYFKKKLVVTPVGGLLEQVKNESNIFISLSPQPKDLLAALQRAINTPYEESKEAPLNNWVSPLIRFLCEAESDGR